MAVKNCCWIPIFVLTYSYDLLIARERNFVQKYSREEIFFFQQVTKNFIKKKQPTQVHWGCTVGAKIKNQNYNDQVIGREKQEKCYRATLHTRRVCKKKDLISSKDCSHPSKYLAFLSLQIHHIKQCGTSSPKIYIVMSPKFTLPRLKQLNYLM